MKTDRYVIHPNEEIPVMGSGRRSVRARVGRVWAHLSWPVLNPRFTAKVRRDLFERLIVRERSVEEIKAAVAQAQKRRRDSRA